MGNWTLPEEEGLKHIKAAYVFFAVISARDVSYQVYCSYDAGVNAFDTANVGSVLY